MKTKEISIIALSGALNSILMSIVPWIGLVILSVWMISFKRYQDYLFALVVALLNGLFSSSPLTWLNIVLFSFLAFLLHALKPRLLIGYSKKGCLTANKFSFLGTLLWSVSIFLVINSLNEGLSYFVHQSVALLVSGLAIAFILSLFNALFLSLTINSLVQVISKGLLKLSLH